MLLSELPLHLIFKRVLGMLGSLIYQLAMTDQTLLQTLSIPQNISGFHWKTVKDVVIEHTVPFMGHLVLVI